MRADCGSNRVLFNQPLGTAIMTDNIYTYTGQGVLVSAEQRNKVLRNTYWLLALSLLPTVAGAWVGCWP